MSALHSEGIHHFVCDNSVGWSCLLHHYYCWGFYKPCKYKQHKPCPQPRSEMFKAQFHPAWINVLFFFQRPKRQGAVPCFFFKDSVVYNFFDPLPDSLSKCFTTPIQWFHRFSFFSHCLLTNFWMFCVCSEKATRSSWIGQLCADTAELCTFIDDHCSELDFAIVV